MLIGVQSKFYYCNSEDLKNFGKVKYFRNRAVGTFSSLIFLLWRLKCSFILLWLTLNVEVVGMLVGNFFGKP